MWQNRGSTKTMAMLDRVPRCRAHPCRMPYMPECPMVPARSGIAQSPATCQPASRDEILETSMRFRSWDRGLSSCSATDDRGIVMAIFSGGSG